MDSGDNLPREDQEKLFQINSVTYWSFWPYYSINQGHKDSLFNHNPADFLIHMAVKNTQCVKAYSSSVC